MRARMLVLAAVASLVAAMPAAAEAKSGKNGKVTVDVQVKRFAVAGRNIVGRGTLKATLTDDSGASRTATRRVTFGVAAVARTCSVLTLKLDDLQLDLLGLRVDTSAVNLKLYGIRSGSGSGVLGRLFCQLSRSTIRLRGSVKAAKRARQVARSLNTRLARKPLRAFQASATLTPEARATQTQPPTQTQTPSCKVLRLVLGPLDLNLLGLMVELYGDTRTKPVVLTITAFPGQGVVGDTFCALAGGPR